MGIKPVTEFHLYTARIPVALIKHFLDGKDTLPAYKPIMVTCVSIPREPAETLLERIIQAMPNRGDFVERKETEEDARENGKEVTEDAGQNATEDARENGEEVTEDAGQNDGEIALAVRPHVAAKPWSS